MKQSQTTDRERKQSAALIEELRQLEATWPSIKAEYDRIDSDCIALAGRLAAETAAGSPRAAATQIELKQLRWKRDGGRAAYTTRRGHLLAQIEALTRPIIEDFHHECLRRTKELAQQRRVERVAHYMTHAGGRGVKVEHNLAAIDKAQERILEALADIRGLQTSTVAYLEERIKRHVKDLDSLDITNTETEELTAAAARDLNPPPEAERIESAVYMGQGRVVPVGLDKVEHAMRKVASLKGVRP